MSKNIILAGAVLFMGACFCFAQEQITLTTYYPSPHGVYDSALADKLGVGDNDGSGDLDSGDVPSNSGEGWIDGNVGVGTTALGARLNIFGPSGVNGVHIRAGEVNGVDYGLWLEDQDGSVQILYADVSGDIGIGTMSPSFRLHVNGDCGGSGTCDSDIAEIFLKPRDELIEPGDVVVLSGQDKHNLHKSEQPYDSRVAGVYSTDPGILILGPAGGIAFSVNKQDPERDYSDTQVPLALAGRAPIKVTDENGPIEKGDLLTTSSSPGRAMKFKLLEFDGRETAQELADKLNENERRRAGVLAKAMEAWDGESKTILCLITLQ